jgi:hypothetical protein
MSKIEELAKKRLDLDKQMTAMSIKFANMADNDPRRITYGKERDAVVTAWALAGRDLDAAILAELQKSA